MIATGFDLGGFFLIGLFALSGLRQGLIQGAMKLVGATAALWATMNHSDVTLAIIQPIIQLPEQYASIAGFAITFVAVLYAFNLVAWFLKKIFSAISLGWLDRIGGVLFGMTKAGLIMSAFVWAFMLLPPDKRGDWQKDSQLFPVIDVFQGYVISIFGFQDELAMLQDTVGGIMSGGGLTGGNIDLDSPLFQKALKALGPEQKKLVDQMIQMQKGEGGDIVQIQTIIKDLGGAKNPAVQKAMEMMPEEQRQQMQELMEGLDPQE